MASQQQSLPSKRSREVEIGDAEGAPPAKRLHSTDLEPNIDETVTQKGSTMQLDPTEIERAAVVIRQQFGLEILLKHDELRLIDQEIAKCQIALEQLRRAKIVPYPSQTGRIEDMINVSTGSGPALVPAGMLYPPSHPPPWGVVDGPYSRQYADWLIRAPEFEGGMPNSRLSSGRIYGSERRSRGQVDEPALSSSRYRGQRGLGSARLQALPLGYPQPKSSRGPLTLKRHSDSKWVKLVCQNCHREDFSSVQGFINHCRISHQVHFATHEDAAQKAGTVEGVDQATGDIIGSSNSLMKGPSTEANLVGAIATNTTTSGNSETVHKYNRHDVRPQSIFPVRAASPPSVPSSFKAQREHRRRGSNMGPPISPGFVPSPYTPHLSELFAKTGRAGNLDVLVNEARTKEDIDALISPTAPEVGDPPSPILCAPHTKSRHVVQGGLSAPTASRKGPGRKATGSGLSTTQRDSSVISKVSPPSPLDHSPSAAMDNNQAPSLVSDDGQSGSEGEDEDEHRPMNPPNGEPQARITNLDSEEELLNHDASGDSSTMEIQEKFRNWKSKGNTGPPGRRPGPQMQT